MAEVDPDFQEWKRIKAMEKEEAARKAEMDVEQRAMYKVAQSSIGKKARERVGFLEEDDVHYKETCDALDDNYYKWMNTSATGLIVCGITYNFLFFELYRTTLGDTKEEYERKRREVGLGTAFAFIIILNILFWALLFVPRQWIYYSMIAKKRDPMDVNGAKGDKWNSLWKVPFGSLFYGAFYGWIGGLRNRCAKWYQIPFLLLASFYIAFSGLLFYLKSVHILQFSKLFTLFGALE